MTPKEHPVIKKLRSNRRALEAAEARVRELSAERTELWMEGREVGYRNVDLATASGVDSTRIAQVCGKRQADRPKIRHRGAPAPGLRAVKD